jgi:hypothetical protein
MAVVLLLNFGLQAMPAATPRLEWAPGNGGDQASLYQEANWLDADTGLAPAANAVNPNVDLNKSLCIRTGAPGGGSGAGGNLRLGTGELRISHAVLRMSAAQHSGILLNSNLPMVLTDAKVLTEFISGGDVTIQGRSELTLYGTNPLTNSTIDLQSSDCFVIFLNQRPSTIDGTYLTHFTVNGAAAVLDSNVYLREYYNGAVIRPKPASGIGLKAFDLPNLQGTRNNYATGFYGAIGQGNASRTSTKYTVRGWGNDIWGTSDQFQFVYRSLSGDGEIVAHVDSVEDTGTSAKGGVMIRESLTAASPYAMTFARPDDTAFFHSRSATGQSATSNGSGGGTNFAKYVRLVRTGNAFTSYYSTNSASGPWLQLGTTKTIAMSNTVYVGLAVTSGDGANLCGTTYSTVSALQDGVPVGTSTFGIFDSNQDVYGYWTNEDKIRSFLLKKGYQVTLAEDAAGQGFSKVYVATEADIAVNLPVELDNKVSFMRVLPWRWIAKKGWGGANSPNPYPTTVGAFWSYEWEPTGNSSLDREFVPMIKGAAQDKDYRWEEVRVRADQTHFLCFNEPMNVNQGNLTVDEAIALWPKALKLGLRLGSPARTDGAAGDTWLQDFMAKAATNGYRVDFVCVHNYNKTTAAALQSWLQAEYNKYQLPIWLTEFNRDNDATTTVAQHQAYLGEVLPMLESLPFLERYAYYNFGGNNMSLFNGDGTTNVLGQIYHDIVSTPAYVNTNAASWCTVTLTSPAAANTSVTNLPVLLAASVSLSNSIISNVEFFANDVSLGIVTNVPYQISVSNLPSGLNTVYATATTTFGERATSVSKQITRVVLVINGATFLPLTRTNQDCWLQFTGSTNQSYQLWRACEILGPWTNLATINAGPLGLGNFNDTDAPTNQAFYRAVIP